MTSMTQIDRAVKSIKERIGDRTPAIGLILGSGLGYVADTLTDAVVIPYGEIPGFPVSRVEGHKGNLVVGRLDGVCVAAMQGRVHYYEGWTMEEVVLPARVITRLGVRTWIITNAAGALDASRYAPGDLCLITDHINMMGANPLTGVNIDELGPRFPDMTAAYSRKLRSIAKKAACSAGLPLKEGVYAAMMGPSYETPAEIHMLRTIGADLVGMSTVPEVIALNHMGCEVLGISCATNLAAGVSAGKLSHEEVKETADRVKDTFEKLVRATVREIHSEINL